MEVKNILEYEKYDFLSENEKLFIAFLFEEPNKNNVLEYVNLMTTFYPMCQPRRSLGAAIQNR